MKALWWLEDDKKRHEEKLFGYTEDFPTEEELIKSLPDTGRFTLYIWYKDEMVGSPDKSMVIDK